MHTAVVAFLLSVTAGAVLTPLARRLARRIGAIDHALSSRKIHKAPIPRLGGIAIVGAFFTPMVALLFTHSGVGDLFYARREAALGLFLGGAIIAALGIYDDLKGAGAKVKFAVQFGVAALVYALGYRIDAIASPFGGAIELGWLGLPFTLLWVAGVINAVNLIDGLDGLAGGVAFISLLTVFVAAAVNGSPLMMLVSAALAGAVLGFLRYNFNPATIFMGDTGSMFLGFVLATTAIRTSLKPTAAVAIVVPIVALGVPIADTLLAMARRAMRGSPLFQADRDHIHHRLLARGLSQRQAVLVLYAASAGLGLVALALARASGLQAALILAGLLLLGGLVLRHLGYLRFECLAEVRELRRRNLTVRSVVRRIAERLRGASHVGHVWDSVREAAPALGADYVSLQLVEERPFGPRHLHFVEGVEEADPRLFRSQHSLRGERPDSGCIELGWADGRSSINRDTEAAVEQLCGHVLQALSRIQSDGEAEKVVPLEVLVMEPANEPGVMRRLASGEG
jgi:UDP-GlcNAc:undecaprenyl-phosphate GlcNAc-1-phosphate transferase